MKEMLLSRSREINLRLSELTDAYIRKNTDFQRVCAEAAAYSLGAGGKRIRPVLVTEFARLTGGSYENALDSACALEMIHTFSLIHDDLPCMDNDDMRRGKPSCHKAFGENIALLAGDALENCAFQVIVSDEKLTYEQRIRLINCLSEAVGVRGMIGGQTIDVMNVGKPFEEKMLLEMYSMKTGALIKCACTMGCICGGKYEMIPYAEKYAEALGLAFQIVDDLLDITSDEKTLGKPVHSDASLGKASYPAVFGQDAARKRASELTKQAMDAASFFGGSEFLLELTEYLLTRKN